MNVKGSSKQRKRIECAVVDIVGHNCSYADPPSTDSFHFLLKLYRTVNHFFQQVSETCKVPDSLAVEGRGGEEGRRREGGECKKINIVAPVPSQKNKWP